MNFLIQISTVYSKDHCLYQFSLTLRKQFSVQSLQTLYLSDMIPSENCTSSDFDLFDRNQRYPEIEFIFFFAFKRKYNRTKIDTTWFKIHRSIWKWTEYHES